MPNSLGIGLLRYNTLTNSFAHAVKGIDLCKAWLTFKTSPMHLFLSIKESLKYYLPLLFCKKNK
jgi:hypothetical protein